jgi:hypothetical protein
MFKRSVDPFGIQALANHSLKKVVVRLASRGGEVAASQDVTPLESSQMVRANWPL